MIRVKKGRACLSLAKAWYARADLEAAALALGPRARVYVTAGRAAFAIEIEAPSRSGGRRRLGELAGEFVNEALNHAYRQKVMAFHAGLARPVLGGLLARGFPAMPEDPLEMLEPQVRLDRERETAQLLERGRALGGRPLGAGR